MSTATTRPRYAPARLHVGVGVTVPANCRNRATRAFTPGRGGSVESAAPHSRGDGRGKFPTPSSLRPRPAVLLVVVLVTVVANWHHRPTRSFAVAPANQAASAATSPRPFTVVSNRHHRRTCAFAPLGWPSRARTVPQNLRHR